MKTLFLIILALLFTACSSTENGPYKKSKQVDNQLEENVPSPWREVNAEGSDYALQNRLTNSFFLFNSACRKYEGSNLNTLTSSILTGIEDLKIIEKKNSTYQEREAAEVLASGKLDGVERFFKIITIQKNNCIYDYVLISTSKKNIETDLLTMKDFMQRIIIK